MITQIHTKVCSNKKAIFAITAMGLACLAGADCDLGAYDGLYVHCRGTEHGLHAYERVKGCVSGSAAPQCYIKNDDFTMCIGPSEFGGTGGDAEIDIDEWPNDTESLDAIRRLCANKCNTLQDTRAPYMFAENCEPKAGEQWQVLNYRRQPTPDPLGEIKVPSYLGCHSDEKMASIRQHTTVIPDGTNPFWPSDSARVLHLACGDYSNCADHFDGSTLSFLTFNDGVEDWGDNEGRADYVATSSGTSSTILSLRMNNSVSGPSSATNEAAGRVEYSLSSCGESECPIYIANLSLENASEIWDLYSDDDGDYLRISNVKIRLRRAALGAWNTSTDEIYIGEGRLDLLVEADVAVGSASPVTVSLVATNDTAVYGELGSGGQVSLLNLRASSGSFSMDADLDCNTLSGRPPIANHGLGSSVSAASTAGLPISSIKDQSFDSDGDLDYKLWIIDGIQRGTSYVIPVGVHTVRLEVEDSRYALDVHESRVMVTYP